MKTFIRYYCAMSIPSYQLFLTPILQIASDGKQHTPRDFEEYSADMLGLSPEDRSLMLASGSMTILKDRTGWAYYALYRAGLLSRPQRATYQITARGLTVLREQPSGIDVKYLRQFNEYMDYISPKPKDGEQTAIPAISVEETAQQTPQGQIEIAYAILQKKLAQELLDQIHARSPAFFEELVVKLLVRMGYGGSERDASVVGRSGDGGIDGLINEDRLGLDRIYVQAKRWKDKVGTPEIRDFVGSLAGGGSHKGVFITTSGFQPGVKDYLRGVQQRVVLIDGQKLAELCIEFGIGVVVEGAYEIKRVDTAFFDEE